MGQGFLLGRPSPPEDIKGLLNPGPGPPSAIPARSRSPSGAGHARPVAQTRLQREALARAGAGRREGTGVGQAAPGVQRTANFTTERGCPAA